jgi:hypothetical protein
VQRLLLCAAASVVALAAPSPALAAEWVFRTPGEAAYCRMEFTQGVFDAFRCVTPNDGFWIRLTGLSKGTNVRVVKGVSPAYRGYRNPAVRVLPFGREFFSSDAFVITCWSRRTGLTCKHYDGLSFWLGRYRGYRIYYDAPGFPPHVSPLFQTAHGVCCGIDTAVLEPANPILLCWRPADGLELSLAHSDGASHDRREKARGFRPAGFPLLRRGASFVWRCRQVTEAFAERCSTAAGKAVFTCQSDRARLTCRNRRKHGFWVSSLSFYAF